MNFRKFVCLFLGLSALVASLVVATMEFYSRYENMARQFEKSFSYDVTTANAIKHATAAFNTFNLLRPVVGSDNAESLVITLGIFNEYVEQMTYPKRQRDSAREIMKDLHNNYVGIIAAKMANTTEAFPVIKALADNRTLIVKDVYNPFFEEKQPTKDIVAFGHEWFNEHRTEIDNRIQRKLVRSLELLPARQIQLSSLTHKSAFVE